MGSRQGQDPVATSAAAAAPDTSATAGSAPLEGRGDGSRQRERHPITSASAERQPLTDLEAIKSDCIRGAYYHDDREQHYARLHRWIMFVSIATSMAAIAEALQGWIGISPTLFQFVAGIAAVIDIVWDVSGKARLHATLKRSAYDLLAEAEEPDADVEKLRVRVTRSMTDEPPIMHAVNELAADNAARSMGRPLRNALTASQRRFRHWLSFASTDFENR